MPSFDLGYAPSPYRSRRPGFDGTSLQTFFAAFPDDDACLEHVFRQRFGSDPQCPRCGQSGGWRRHHVEKHYFHRCGGILSPMAGVVFSRTHIALQLWFYAMLHYANSAESISGSFLARQLGISEPTAFRVGQRIRWHMAALDESIRVGVAGEPVVLRLSKILRVVNPQIDRPNEVTVLLLCDARRVNSTVIVHPGKKGIRKAIRSKVDPLARLVTDCYWTFRAVSNFQSLRSIVDYVPGFYFERAATENLNHGFMQYFNLSFANQFRGVNLENAWLYIKEYEFRYNRRHRSSDVFTDLTARFPSFDQASLDRLKARHFIGAKKH